MMYFASPLSLRPPGRRCAPAGQRICYVLLAFSLLALLLGSLLSSARPAQAASKAASTSNAASTASLKAAAAATQGGAAPAAVTGNLGDFQGSIPFQIPAYHGLQPPLGLAYDSLGGNGLVGQGWQLTGFPQIDRTSAERGAPRFSGDVFQLNGEDLVPNTSLGGQYVTKRQSFVRISYDATAHAWTFFDKSGVKYTLGQGVNAGPGVSRWLITSMTDPHGNTVTYSYWCDPKGFQCYPNTVSYNGTTITFYREARPDVISQAVGGVLITSYRIKTVEVQVGTAIARVYALGYVTSAATGRSLLSTVTQYGTDATVDASGKVTGGTALPPIKASYQVDGTQAFTGGGLLWAYCAPSYGALQMADVNGDGKADLVCSVYNSYTHLYDTYVALANGSGFNSPTLWLSQWCNNVPTLADVTGDGRADLVCPVYNPATYSYSMAVSLSTGTSFNGSGSGWWLANWCPSAPVLADVNGDGRADLVCEAWNGGGYNMSVAFSNGVNAFTDQGRWATNWCWTLPRLADINGDGKADLVCTIPQYNYWGYIIGYDVYVLFSNGVNAFSGGGQWLSGWGNYYCNGVYNHNQSSITIADVNGDGKADLVCLSPVYNYYNYLVGYDVNVALSNGSTGFSVSQWTSGWSGFCQAGTGQIFLADVNGDGKTDLVCYYPNKNYVYSQVYVALSNGSSAFSGESLWRGSWCGTDGQFFLADTNGDGRADLVCQDNSTGNIWTTFAGSQVIQNDLLTSLTNQNGGTTSVTYKVEKVPGSAAGPTLAAFSPQGAPAGAIGGLPGAIPLVTRISQNAGVSWDAPPIVTDYTSSGPEWDPLERRFLGYGTIAATNSSGATATTIFRQAPNYPVDRPAQISITDANGTLLASTTNIYQESASGGVYTSLLSKVTGANCAGASLCQSSSTTYQYDGYGNIIQVLDNGDDAVSGDERLTVITYYPNTGAYLLDYPAAQVIYAGTTTAGQILSATAYTYDGQASATAPPLKGDVTATTVWLNTTNTWLTATASYDSFGNLLSVTDALGHTSTTSYESTYHLYPTQVCNALHQCMGQTWNTVLGVQTSQIDQANSGTPTSTMAYDVFGRLVKQTNPDGSSRTMAYVNQGNPATQYIQTAVSDGSADGLWSRTYSDGLGRTYITVGKSTSTVVTMYNTQGQVAAVSAPYFTGATPQFTTYQYDALGRQIVLTHPDGSTRTTSYAVGINAADPDFKTARLMQTSCDELNYCIRQGMNGYGQPVVVDEFTNKTTFYARTHIRYDVLGNLIGYTDTQGNVASITYDSLGRKIAMTDPDLGHWTYGYDADGNVTSQTDARGVTVSYAYDALNRPLTAKNGATTLASYTYDQASQPQGIGRLTSMSDPSGSTTFSYDVNGRLIAMTKVISGQSFTLKQSYDQAGRIASLTYPDGEVVPYTYDASGCLKSVGNYVTNASCTANNSPASLTLGNGLTESLSYSPTRQWLTGITIKQGSTTLLSYTLSNRNARGQLLAQTSSNPNLDWTYSYDALGRLTQATNTTNAAWNQSFSYDQLGRIFPGTGGQTLTYPAAGHAHAPATHNGTAYTYDANGNRTGGDGRTYTYDALNRLSSVSGTAYLYDGLGQRVQVGSTRYLTFNYQLLAEQTGSSKLQYYYYGNTRVAQKDQNGVVTYYLNDQLGTANALSNGSGGTSGQAVYGSYGQLLQKSGVSVHFGLAGQQLDASGLYHIGARYLDPVSSTFTSPDPSGKEVDPTNPQTLNRYAYANNDPVDVTDPSGYGPNDFPPTVYDFGTGTITALTRDYTGGFLTRFAVTFNPETGDTYVTNLLFKEWAPLPGTYGLLEENAWAGTTYEKNHSVFGLFGFVDVRPTFESTYLSLRFRADLLVGHDPSAPHSIFGYYTDLELSIRVQAGPYADTVLDYHTNNLGRGPSLGGSVKPLVDYLEGTGIVALPPKPTPITSGEDENSNPCYGGFCLTDITGGSSFNQDYVFGEGDWSIGGGAGGAGGAGGSGGGGFSFGIDFGGGFGGGTGFFFILFTITFVF